MSRWSFFFLLVPVLGVGLFAIAGQYNWSLPENVSTFGVSIDRLYYIILAITGLTFIATNAFLVGILYHFGRSPEGRRATYTHGSRTLEIIWTIIPAIVLGLIALVQMPAWVEIKFPSRKPDIAPIARVIARQFEWRIIYPGPDAAYDTPDDIHVPNELHIVLNRRTLIDLRSMDVLHSFFLPHLRVKQDAVPGLSIPVWFDCLKSTRQFQADHARLEPADIIDWGLLLVQLKKPKSPPAEFLREKLNVDVRAKIDDWDDKFDPNRALTAEVLADLNRIISSEDIYDKQRFADVRLSADTLDHLAQGPGGRHRILLNRQVLADAFPLELRGSRYHYELVCAELCGWGHYKMKGRLIVHETQEELDGWLSQRRAEQEASR